jgi:tetratricopeptide (TPR) repeat protein
MSEYEQEFLEDAGNISVVMKRLQNWFSKDRESILLVGQIGVGKSRLVTEFLSRLPFYSRFLTRVLMPTPDEIRDSFPPLLSRKYILFLNDLHEYRGIDDAKLKSYIQSGRFRVVATIPPEKRDPNWDVLSTFVWTEMLLIDLWHPEHGRKLAEAIGKKDYDPSTFRGTPLSVIAPDVEMRRAYEILPEGPKEVLKVLKIAKLQLGCYVDFQLVSGISDRELRHADFQNVVSREGFWCKTQDSKAILADGVEQFIEYEVSREDACRLQLFLMRTDKPIPGSAEYLVSLGERFLESGDYDRALNCYDHSLALVKSPAAWVRRGYVLRYKGNNEEAIRSFDKALEIDPAYREAWYMRWEGAIHNNPFGELLRTLFSDGISSLLKGNRRRADTFANRFEGEYVRAINVSKVDQFEGVLRGFEDCLTRENDLKAFSEFTKMCYSKVNLDVVILTSGVPGAEPKIQLLLNEGFAHTFRMVIAGSDYSLWDLRDSRTGLLKFMVLVSPSDGRLVLDPDLQSRGFSLRLALQVAHVVKSINDSAKGTEDKAHNIERLVTLAINLAEMTGQYNVARDLRELAASLRGSFQTASSLATADRSAGCAGRLIVDLTEENAEAFMASLGAAATVSQRAAYVYCLIRNALLQMGAGPGAWLEDLYDRLQGSRPTMFVLAATFGKYEASQATMQLARRNIH